eukprot:XP_003728642.1 PREDICTED: uncharacterized protein LOC100892377 [Strongylocentrotus purpuratus]
MKNLIHGNGWKMTTPFDSKLGEPVLKSIEKDVSNSSHVVYLITKEDGEHENVNHTMTIEMAFQSLTDKGLGGRVIPVFCCDTSFVSPKLRSLTGANIHDEALEERLRKSIDMNIRKEREEEYRSGSEPLQGASSSQPQQPSHQSKEEILENVSGRQEDFDENLITIARKIVKHEEIYKLGKGLGFEPADIERYVNTNMKNAHISYMGTLSMLRDWRDTQTKATECKALKDVLRKVGQIRLADELFCTS